MYASSDTKSDELEEAFYAIADQISVDDAEPEPGRWRGIAPEALLSANLGRPGRAARCLGCVGDWHPSHLDTDWLWAATRSQGPGWMRFPIGLYADTGETVWLDLREGAQAAWVCTGCSSAPPAPGSPRV